MTPLSAISLRDLRSRTMHPSDAVPFRWSLSPWIRKSLRSWTVWPSGVSGMTTGPFLGWSNGLPMVYRPAGIGPRFSTFS